MMKRVLLFLCLSVMANLVTGQSIKRYEGMMKLPSDLNYFKGIILGWSTISGDGYYDYYENSDGDRVKHGKFFLKSHGYEFKGTYSHGLKEGQWIVMHPGEKGNVKSYYNNMKITFKNDVMNGPCEYISRPTQGLPSTVTVSCYFTNGILTGDASVRYKYDYNSATTEYKGKIDQEGLLYGIWSVSKKGGIETSQKWMYYKGVGVYAESFDYSTGERTVIYSAFDNLKKLPDIDKIKDTVVMGKECIVYESQIAIKVSSNYFFPPIIRNFPDGMCYSEILEQQENSWRYTYSSKAYTDMIEFQQRERQKQIDDSIRIEQQRRKYEIEQAYREFDYYINQIYWNYIKKIETYDGNSTSVRLRPINTNGEVLECYNVGDTTSFKIGKEMVSGLFRKEYVKTDAGEAYCPQTPVELWSNEDGSLLIYQIEIRGSKCELLIIREGKNRRVYSFSSLAQECW